MTDTSREVGGVFGIALLGTIFFAGTVLLVAAVVANRAIPGRQVAPVAAPGERPVAVKV